MAALIGCDDDDGHRERLSDGEERICAGGRTDADGREGGGTRRRRWTATTTGFEIGHERAFISSPAFQPTYARARPRP